MCGLVSFSLVIILCSLIFCIFINMRKHIFISVHFSFDFYEKNILKSKTGNGQDVNTVFLSSFHVSSVMNSLVFL